MKFEQIAFDTDDTTLDIRNSKLIIDDTTIEYKCKFYTYSIWIRIWEIYPFGEALQNIANEINVLMYGQHDFWLVYTVGMDLNNIQHYNYSRTWLSFLFMVCELIQAWWPIHGSMNWVTIGLGIGLSPIWCKPLPMPMLTYCQVDPWQQMFI